MRLAYDDAGSGDCVVLIHGHPFDRTLREPQHAALRDGFRVLAPDLRGFGQSPVTPHCVRMREYAADVEDLLDDLGIRRAAASGLSMGGLVTMELGTCARLRAARHTGRQRSPALPRTGKPRRDPHEIVPPQIDLISAPRKTSTEGPAATQNGGTVRVAPDKG